MPRPETPTRLDRILAVIRNPGRGALIGFGLAVMLAVALLRAPEPGGPIPPLPPGLETLHLRSGESLPEDLEGGITAYRRDRLDEAIPRLERAATTGGFDLVRRTYLGNALARRGQWEAAIEVLDDVLDDPLPEPWRSEAQWARAIALRETGRISEARTAFTALAADAGAGADRAREELEKLPAP